MENKIKALFADILQVDETRIQENTTPDDMPEWDSMNHLNLISAFEDEFAIDIDPEHISVMMANFNVFKTTVLEKMG